MNVEIEAEAALFPGKEDINGIAVAVQYMLCRKTFLICSVCYLKKWAFSMLEFRMFKLHTKNTIKNDTLSLQPSDKGESAAWLVHKRPSSIDRAADMDYSM